MTWERVPGARGGARGVVLVVEDHADTRELYGTVLSSAGFLCLVAGNREGALQQAKREHLDAVVLDLGLPRLEEGLALARQLQELPWAPPLIALTGHPEKQLPKGVFRGYLMKPFDPETLVATVAGVVKRT